MTKEEEKEIIRVCGEDYDWWDIPAYIRERDKKGELAKANSPLIQNIREKKECQELQEKDKAQKNEKEK
jgi:hypothetical protein